MRILLSLFVVVMFVFLSGGCRKNSAVSGIVTFPDGTPLTVGQVVFETPDFSTTGRIQADGSYQMGTYKVDDGIPKGKYRVSIQNVMQVQEDWSRGPNVPPITIFPKEWPIDKKFTSPGTSGLTCEVKGRTKYDITVEKPQ